MALIVGRCKHKHIFFIQQSRKRDRQGQKCVGPTIGDRHFVSALQFYIHKCGQVTLDYLEIDAPKEGGNGHPIVEAYKGIHRRHGHGRLQPLVDVPIPKNINDFKGICLRFAFPFQKLGTLIIEFTEKTT
jgi:hypothetical protein